MMSFFVGAVAGCMMTLGFGEAIGGHVHPGVDYYCGYQSPVYSPYDGVVTFRDDSTGTVTMVVGTSSPRLFVVAHMATTTVTVGDTVLRGDLIGTEGFKGETYVWGRRENSPAASHRHYGLYRLEEAKEIMEGEYYLVLEDWAYKNVGGNYLRILDIENGYDGACNPETCL